MFRKKFEMCRFAKLFWDLFRKAREIRDFAKPGLSWRLPEPSFRGRRPGGACDEVGQGAKVPGGGITDVRKAKKTRASKISKPLFLLSRSDKT